MRHLYRGILPPLITSGSISSINFALYEYFKVRIGQWESVSYSQMIFLSGAASGAIISAINAPIGLIKIQQQVSKAHLESPTILSVIKKVYAAKGLLGFYKGIVQRFP